MTDFEIKLGKIAEINNKSMEEYGEAFCKCLGFEETLYKKFAITKFLNDLNDSFRKLRELNGYWFFNICEDAEYNNSKTYCNTKHNDKAMRKKPQEK